MNCGLFGDQYNHAAAESLARGIGPRCVPEASRSRELARLIDRDRAMLLDKTVDQRRRNVAFKKIAMPLITNQISS